MKSIKYNNKSVPFDGFQHASTCAQCAQCQEIVTLTHTVFIEIQMTALISRINNKKKLEFNSKQLSAALKLERWSW